MVRKENTNLIMEELAKEHELQRDPQPFRQVTAPLEVETLSKNEQIVFEMLTRIGMATRSILVQLCDLPRTTIYDALIRLQRRGLVNQVSEERTARGRPKIFFYIHSLAFPPSNNKRNQFE